MGMAAQQDYTSYTLTMVLATAISTSIIVTDNVRKPPRRGFTLDELSTLPTFASDETVLPLCLFAMKNGEDVDSRELFKTIQTKFNRFTGRMLDVVADFTSVNNPSDNHEFTIDVLIGDEHGMLPVDSVGAGFWEALYLMALTSGIWHIVCLDEPAIYLYPSLQTKLLGELNQVPQALITSHSPYLVPDRNQDGLSQIFRFVNHSGITSLHPIPERLSMLNERDKTSKLAQTLLSVDARASLFSAGVILVEGDTEAVVLGKWFDDRKLLKSQEALSSMNLHILVVGSDTGFGTYAQYCSYFGIPFAVIADGPALHPKRFNNLLSQLNFCRRAPAKDDSEDDFAETERLWADQGVYTFAAEFGTDGSKGGEIEVFLQSVDPDVWRRTSVEFRKSKVRQAQAFAEIAQPKDGSPELEQIRKVWSQLVGWFNNQIGISELG
jgi:hypothetical protein